MRPVLKVLLAVLLVSGLVVAGGAALPPLRIYDEGTALSQRFRLDFIGNDVSCVDTSGTSTTTCTFTDAPPVPQTITSPWISSLMQGWGTGYSNAAPRWYPGQPSPFSATASIACNTVQSSVTLGAAPTQRNGLQCPTTTLPDTSGTQNNRATVFMGGSLKLKFGPKMCAYLKFVDIDRLQAAIVGMTQELDQFKSYTVNVDFEPNYNYVLFRYLGTTWYACVHAYETAPPAVAPFEATCTNMGAALDTNAHVFCVDCSTGACVFTIDDAYSTTMSSGLPDSDSLVAETGVTIWNGATDGGRSSVQHFWTSYSLY